MNVPTESTTTEILQPARRAVWRYVGGLAPVMILWSALAGWLAWQLYDRADWSDRSDEATLREWIDETRIFRQTLPEQVREYIAISPDDDRRRRNKRDEIQEQIRSMIEPTRVYANQLPAFPEIYSLSVILAARDERIGWDSPVPRPAPTSHTPVRSLVLNPVPEDNSVAIVCDYRLHAFNRLQRREEYRRQTSLVAGALLVTASLLAGLFVWRFLRREHARELDRFTAVADREHRERELLSARLAGEQAEKAAGELHRRAIEAEKAALETKSQIHASIGVLAGSYAHNIKNLLVRPNDLLARCLDGAGPEAPQKAMLEEVKATLSVVTERLQQILRTIRRDAQPAEMKPLDLAQLAASAADAWRVTARDKWKADLDCDVPVEPVMVRGDVSHLQQAIENLLFNARDATFEMRNHLRDTARMEGPHDRKQSLLAAASWKGHVSVSVMQTSHGAELIIRDNGIGMSPEIAARCRETHFSTKRDNALYEGYSAGMGLGLSFVVMVIERHGARLEIDTAPQAGATFRITFPSMA